jgi:hypothetical protein
MKEYAEAITEWVCSQTFHLGGPRFLSETLYRLMVRLNAGRETAWDVDAVLTATLDGPERIRSMARLRAEFADACTKLTANEQQRLLSDIRSGAYDEPGPRLQVLNTANDDESRDSADQSISRHQDPA